MSRNRRRLLIAGGAAAALLLLARLAAVSYAEFAWYEAQGATALWRARAVNGALLGGAAWVAGSLFVFANLYMVLRSVRHLIVARQVANIEIESAVPNQLLMGVAAAASAVLGGVLMFLQDDWTTLALARYVPAFGFREPSLDRDAGFWVTHLPLERAWYSWAQGTLVAVVIVVVLLYALTRSLRWTPRGLHAANYVRRHLSALGALLLVLLAWGYRLELLLLPANLGPEGYFGPVEQRMVTMLLVLAIFTLSCSALVLWAGFVGQVRIAFATVTAVIVVALVVQQGGRSLIRMASRADLEAPSRLAPYLATQASFTRRAYGLPREIRTDSSQLVPGIQALGRAAAVWDPAAVIAAVERGGRRREAVGSVGWQAGPEGLVAIVAAREPDSDSAVGGAGERWVVARVAAAPPAGDMTPTARSHQLPPVYFYPGAMGDLLVSDAGRRLSAPLLGRGIQRLASALAVQNLRLLFDPPPDPALRLLAHRDVPGRIALLAPVFEQGSEVTPISDGDSLYWAVPLYLTERSFPLSHYWQYGGQPTKYFQHAATALVNAHTGRVRLVSGAGAGAEPVATAWMDRFPLLFAVPSELPASIAHSLPVAELSARAQAFALGMVNAADSGRPPMVVAGGSGRDSSTGTLASLPYAPPGAASVSRAFPLIQMPSQRLRALVVVSGGAAPATSVVRMDSLAAAWPELLESLNRPPEGEGATSAEQPVFRTRPLLLPSPGAPVLLQPSYAWRADGLPSLVRVAVLQGDSVRTAGSLAALGRQPSGAVAETPGGGAAAALYERMREALRRADWSTFGRAFEALGELLGVPPEGQPIPSGVTR